MRGLTSEEDWACLEPFVIEHGTRSGRLNGAKQCCNFDRPKNRPKMKFRPT